MFKNLLLKWANKIINKYGIHEITLNSIVKFHDNYFEIVKIDLSLGLYGLSNIRLDGVELLKEHK